MRKFKLLISILLIAQLANAQITFQKIYQGPNQYVSTVQPTTDGGYIIAGTTNIFGSDYDFHLIKTDAMGTILWTRTFGGNISEFVHCAQQTTDGGYIMCGTSYSFTVGAYDVYLVKTDANGNMLWSKTFGGVNPDEGRFVQQTTDGGYIITGATESFGAGFWDIYLVKTDSSGNLLWSKTFGNTNWDQGNCVQQTSDGGYIITGQITYPPGGNASLYLVKTDAIGDTIWTKTLSGIGGMTGSYVRQTTDGGYIIAGSGCISTGPVTTCDTYLIKTNVNGNLLWIKSFGGAGSENLSSVQQTTDGGYIAAGATNSFGSGSPHAYLIKTDAYGDTLWTKIFGDTIAGASSVRQTTDGGYIIGGNTYTPPPPAAGYLIKTDSLGHSGCYEGNAATIVASPAISDTNFSTIVTSPLTIVTTPTTLVDSGGTVTTLCFSDGINEITNDNYFLISPNPATNELRIQDAKFRIEKIEIYNVLEEKVYSHQSETSNQQPVTVNVSTLAPGIYFVKVFDGEKSYCKKLIVER